MPLSPAQTSHHTHLRRRLRSALRGVKLTQRTQAWHPHQRRSDRGRLTTAMQLQNRIAITIATAMPMKTAEATAMMRLVRQRPVAGLHRLPAGMEVVTMPAEAAAVGVATDAEGEEAAAGVVVAPVDAGGKERTTRSAARPRQSCHI